MGEEACGADHVRDQFDAVIGLFRSDDNPAAGILRRNHHLIAIRGLDVNAPAGIVKNDDGLAVDDKALFPARLGRGGSGQHQDGQGCEHRRRPAKPERVFI